jgi:hypothetical protein
MRCLSERRGRGRTGPSSFPARLPSELLRLESLLPAVPGRLLLVEVEDLGRDHLEALRDLAEPLVEESVESAQLTDALRAGEPSYEAVVLVPLRSAERLLGLALLYCDLHAVLPSRDTLAHLGFLARELAGPLEASAVGRLRALLGASAAAGASLLTRLPAEAVRRQRLELADVLPHSR